MNQEANSNGKVTKDSVRAALFRSKKRKSRLVTIEDGIDIEVREPTIGNRNRILKAAGISAQNQEVDDIGAMQLAAVVECCFMPGTDEKVFSWDDEAVIHNMPANSWFDELSTTAVELMNKDPQEAGKSSSKTQQDSTSST